MSALSGQEENDLRYAQARSLESLRPPELYAAARKMFTDAEWRIRRAAWEALLRADVDEAGLLAFLLECLADGEDAGTRGAALEALIALGDRGVPFLTAALPGRDGRVKRYILDVLLQVRSPNAAGAARALLGDPDENVGFAAAEVVGVSGGVDDAADLLARLPASDGLRRFALLAALVQIAKRHPFVAKAEAFAAYAADPLLREPAVELLGYCGDKEAAPLLWAQVQAGRPLDALILALDRLRARFGAALQGDAQRVALIASRCQAPGSGPAVRRAAFDLLEAVAPSQLAQIVPLLAEQDAEWLIERLTRMEDFRLRELLPAMTEHERGRSAAARLYLLRPSLRGESALLALLTQPGRHRAETIAALAAVGNLRSAPHLIALCADADELVASRASDALLSLARRDAGVEAVVFKSIAGVKPGVLARLLPAVGEFTTPRAIDRIFLALNDPDPAVRRAAVTASEKMAGNAEIARLLAVRLADEDEEVRKAAAEVCGRAQLTASARALEVLLDDDSPWVQAAALEALGMIGAGVSAQKLGELLSRGGLIAVAAAGEAHRGPYHDADFQRYGDLLEGLEDDAAAALVKSLAAWPQEMPRTWVERLWLHDSWAVRSAVVHYLAEKKPVWLSEVGRDWLAGERDDWVRTQLQELVGM